MNKKLTCFFAIFLITIISFFLYQNALHNTKYQGLPTVPCIDNTQRILQNYTFMLNIIINGQAVTIDTKVGHDYGNCLHEIYVNDSSGKIYVQANDIDTYTLGQFFDVWHETFNQNQIMNYQVDNNHSIKIVVNGNQVSTFRDTPLLPNSNIEVIYQ